MTVFSPIRISLLALMLASVTCLAAQTPSQTESKGKVADSQASYSHTAPSTQTVTPAEQKAPQQNATQPTDQSQKQPPTENQAQKPNQYAEKDTDESSDQERTTPVTPQTKKAESDAAPESTKRAMSE